MTPIFALRNITAIDFVGNWSHVQNWTLTTDKPPPRVTALSVSKLLFVSQYLSSSCVTSCCFKFSIRMNPDSLTSCCFGVRQWVLTGAWAMLGSRVRGGGKGLTGRPPHNSARVSLDREVLACMMLLFWALSKWMINKWDKPPHSY